MKDKYSDATLKNMPTTKDYHENGGQEPTSEERKEIRKLLESTRPDTYPKTKINGSFKNK